MEDDDSLMGGLGQRLTAQKNQSRLQHKVILFGEIYRGGNEVEMERFRFIHQRIDAQVTEGWIPVGFLSSVLVEAQDHIFLATRSNDVVDESGAGHGPEFQISWKADREVLGGGEGWNSNLDSLWTG